MQVALLHNSIETLKTLPRALKSRSSRTLRAVLVLATCITLVLLTFVSAYAWDIYAQHKTNEFTGAKTQPTAVVLNKFESGGSAIAKTPIPNTEFYLYKIENKGTASETQVQVGERYLTDSVGQIVIDALEPGFYFFEETQPAHGYTFARDEHDAPITRYYFEVELSAIEPQTVIVNAYNDPIQSDLEIIKHVENENGSGLSDEQKAAVFSFEVTLSESGSFPLLIDGVEKGTVASGDIIELKSGQRARITGLSANTRYRISEVYDGGPYSISAKNTSGTITEEGAVAEFTNTYITMPLSTLTLTKELEEGSSTSELFTFEVTFSDGETYSFMREGASDPEDLAGGKTVALAAGESVTFVDVPVGVTYTIKERTTPGFTPVFDTATGKIIAEGSEAVFLNTEDALHEGDEDGALDISKEVVGDASPDDTFTFTVTFDESFDSSECTYTIEGGGADPSKVYTLSEESTITLTAGQTAHFANLPKGLTYRVDEASSLAYRSSVTSYNGTIISNSTSLLEFVNEVLAQDEECDLSITKRTNYPTTERFTFDIYVGGTLFDTVTLSAGETTHVTIPRGAVYEVVERAHAGFEATRLVNGFGTANAASIEVVQYNDSTTVPLVEVAGDKEWVTTANPGAVIPGSITVDICDGERVVKQVTVTKGAGWKFAEMLPAYHADGSPVTYTLREHPVDGFSSRMSGMHITNVAYGATTAQIPVEKKIECLKTAPIKSSSFSFEITPLEGAPRPPRLKTTITGEGTGAFDAITFVSPGTYKYAVREENTHVAGYVYDTTSYLATVTVENTGEQLAVTSITYSMGAVGAAERIIFTNTYDDSLVVTGTTMLTVNKVWKNDNEDTRPTSVTVDLLKNGKVYQSATLYERTRWSHTFAGLDRSASYVLVEREVPAGYTVSYTKQGPHVLTITNIGSGSSESTVTPKGSSAVKTGDSSLTLLSALVLISMSVAAIVLLLPRVSRKDDEGDLVEGGGVQ